MNKILFLLVTLFFSLVSCKKERNASAVVLRNCTGTYLQSESKNYRVCNIEKLSPYADGDKVTATFKKTKDCNGSAKDQIVCAMVFEFESWIDVEKIK
jgi:hypothetical protein